MNHNACMHIATLINMQAHHVLQSIYYVCSLVLQTFGGCYDRYDLNLTYDPHHQDVTSGLLQKFYNGLILHRRFIIKVMFDKLKPLRLPGKKEIHDSLHTIKNHLEHSIARLQYLVSVSNIIDVKAAKCGYFLADSHFCEHFNTSYIRELLIILICCLAEHHWMRSHP